MLRIKVGDAQAIIQTTPVTEEKVVLEVQSSSEEYQFYCHVEGERKYLGKARTKYLSSEVAGGFTGVVMGMYAVDCEEKWEVFNNLTWIQQNALIHGR